MKRKLILKVDRTPEEAKKKFPKRLIAVNTQQEIEKFDENKFYMLNIQREEKKLGIYLTLLILLILFICLFPIWPLSVKLNIWLGIFCVLSIIVFIINLVGFSYYSISSYYDWIYFRI